MSTSTVGKSCFGEVNGVKDEDLVRLLIAKEEDTLVEVLFTEREVNS